MGFITGEDGVEYFVQLSDIPDDSTWLETGPKCQFDIDQSAKERKAINGRVF